MNLQARTYLWYISILRIYCGYYLLWQGIRKYQHDFPKGDWIGRQIGELATLDIYPWYRRLLAEYVVPHHEVVGYLVVIGEIATGLCLLLGLFTRVSAFIAVFMVGNYLLGPGMARGGIMFAQQQIFILALLIVLLSGAGKTLGLDGLMFGSRGGARRG